MSRDKEICLESYNKGKEDYKKELLADPLKIAELLTEAQGASIDKIAELSENLSPEKKAMIAKAMNGEMKIEDFAKQFSV